MSIARHVLHIGGYDPMSAVAFHARFRRELVRFSQCWGLKATVSEPVIGQDMASWTVMVSGPGWCVTTSHDLLRWDDVIEQHRTRSVISRAARGVAALVDFVVHGALWGYLTVAWRYAAFFLYPFSVLLLVLASGAALGLIMAKAGLPTWAATAIALTASVGAFWHLVSRTHVSHLLDDWIFASEHVRATDPVLAQRMKVAANSLTMVPRDVDVLVVGHSLGAVLCVDVLDNFLNQDPQPRDIGFVTLGSSILKLALHRRAAGLRESLARINTSGRLQWTEYQSLSDVMNFFRADPVKVLGLPGPSPVLRQVRFRRMLTPAFYAKVKRNFFRLHCQFVSGNDRKAPFDYFMTICGPFSVSALAASIDGAERWIGDSGHVTEPGMQALLPRGVADRDRDNSAAGAL